MRTPRHLVATSIALLALLACDESVRRDDLHDAGADGSGLDADSDADIAADDVARDAAEDSEDSDATDVFDDTDGSGTEVVSQPGDDAAFLDELAAESDTPIGLRVRDGIPRFVTLDVAVPSRIDDDVARAFIFLDAHADFYRIAAPSETLIPELLTTDEESRLSTVRLQQHVRGVPVLRSHLAIVFDENDHVRATHGAWLPDFGPDALDVEPRVGTRGLGGNGVGRPPVQVGPPQLVIVDGALVPEAGGGRRLAWRVLHQDVSGFYEALYDANDGSLIARLPGTQTIDPRVVCENPGPEPVAACDPERTWWIDGIETDKLDPGEDADGDGQRVETFLGLASRYTLELLTGDITGGMLAGPYSGQVYVEFVNEDGDPAPNASASPGTRALAFYPGWTVIDVVGHEYGHLMLDALGALDYQGESGALNESFADCTGQFVERLWAEIYAGATFSWDLNATADTVLRDMSDPPRLGQPDHMSSTFSGDGMGLRPTTDEADHGYVHTNSGIPNKVFYLLTDGGEHNFWRVEGRGVRTAYSFLYRTIKTYLGPTSDFEDMRQAMFEYAYALVGQTNQGGLPSDPWTIADACSVEAAWASVGLGNAWAVVRCPLNWMALTDDDNDGIEALNDNCRYVANPDQADLDTDHLGDVCDPDDDWDGVDDMFDNCPRTTNPQQKNNDAWSEAGIGLGDACDPDDDNDNRNDDVDNCDFVSNYNQENSDGDEFGDACDADDDNDTVLDHVDNCPQVANTNQWNNDGDVSGNVCDADDDNDLALDVNDNCPFTATNNVADGDSDGDGDVCDNCPNTANPDQDDRDRDGVGRACEGAVMDDPITTERWDHFERLDLEGSRGEWLELPPNCPSCPIVNNRGWGVYEPADLLVSVATTARAEIWTRSGTLVGVVDGSQGEARVTVMFPQTTGFVAPGVDTAVATDALMLRLLGDSEAVDVSLQWE